MIALASITPSLALADDDGATGYDYLEQPMTPAAAAAREAPAADAWSEWLGFSPSDRWVPWPMAGPFDELADVCTDGYDYTCAESSGLSTQFPDGTCDDGDCKTDPGPSRARHRSGLIREVRVFRVDDNCHLGIRTRRGWYVTDDVEGCRNSGSQRIEMRSRELVIRDVVGGAGRDVYFRFEVDSSHHIGGGTRSESVMVCGVGPSNVPSCTRPMVTWWWSWARSEDGRTQIRSGSGKLRIRFGPGGMVARRVRGTLLNWQRDLVGRHRIEFP